MDETTIAEIIDKLTAKSQSPSFHSAVLLGIVAGVCARLKSVRPMLEANKNLYYSFYIREILGSRSPVPQHIVTAYNDFFASFTTQEDLQRDIVPSLEKALLRAPEVVLNDLVSPMVKSLPSDIDFSEALADHLLKPFLANLKSQNPTVRNGALSAFSACLTHSRDEKHLQKITNDILGPLASSKINVAEQRTLHSRMLGFLPYDVVRSATICTTLAMVVSKESNETALNAETAALAEHISSLLAAASEDIDQNLGLVTNAFSKGLSDKRPAIRKTWVISTGDVLWRLKIQSVDTHIGSRFVDAVAPKLWDCFDDVIANLHASALSGLAVVAYIVVATYDFIMAHCLSEQVIARGRKSEVHGQSFGTNPKSSILNHRIYTKLSGDDETRWVIRALGVYRLPIKDTAQASSGTSEDDWALAFLYFIVAADVSPSSRKAAAIALRDLYALHPKAVSQIIIQGLWIWHRQVENEEKDGAATAAKTRNSDLYLAVRSICPPRTDASDSLHIADAEVLRSQLIDMLVLARPDVLPKVSWIDLCLSVGQDPGDLARAETDRIMQMLLLGHHSAAVSLATYKAAAELAFVSPDAITPKLVEQVQADLSGESISKYGPTEVAIARTPEGTAFIDVLTNKNNGRVLDKNARDYETLKWEEDVRNQQARKKGQEKKPTADEKAKVDAQLIKEAKIREEVLQLERNLRRGIGFIHALATGPPTEATLWMGPCLEALLEVITAGAGLLLGNEANETYIACSNLVSFRLGSLRPFIGLATLRSLETVQLPENLSQEPLGGK